MAMTPRQSDYVTEVRTLTNQLWNAINGLADHQREWNALNYSQTLPDGGDRDGTNNGITSASVGACVFDAANAIITVLNTGVATNLAKLL